MTSTSVPESEYRSRFKVLQVVEDKKDFIIEVCLVHQKYLDNQLMR